LKDTLDSAPKIYMPNYIMNDNTDFNRPMGPDAPDFSLLRGLLRRQLVVLLFTDEQLEIVCDELRELALPGERR